MNEQQHLGTIHISLSLIWTILGLDEDYQLRGVQVDPAHNTLVVTVEHPDLPATDEGSAIPRIKPTYTRQDYSAVDGVQFDSMQVEA